MREYLLAVAFVLCWITVSVGCGLIWFPLGLIAAGGLGVPLSIVLISEDYESDLD